LRLYRIFEAVVVAWPKATVSRHGNLSQGDLQSTFLMLTIR
jgi:hypothetical protein